VSERQLRNYYRQATRIPGNTGAALLRLLETRLDALVLRAGFARTIFAARQYVRHGHVLVNGKRVTMPSRTSMCFRIRPTPRQMSLGHSLGAPTPPAASIPIASPSKWPWKKSAGTIASTSTIPAHRMPDQSGLQTSPGFTPSISEKSFRPFLWVRESAALPYPGSVLDFGPLLDFDTHGLTVLVDPGFKAGK